MSIRITLARLAATATLLTASIALAKGAPTPQDHHCKLADGTFDGAKTHKQCDDAKGTWAKDATQTGTLRTGVVAVGGETTGVVLELADKTSIELDLHGDKALLDAAKAADKTAVTVTGYPMTKKGVEIAERHLFVVSTLAAVPKK